MPIVSRGSVIIELKMFSLIVSQEFFSLLSHERLKYQYKFLQLEIQSFVFLITFYNLICAFIQLVDLSRASTHRTRTCRSFLKYSFVSDASKQIHQ